MPEKQAVPNFYSKMGEMSQSGAGAAGKPSAAGAGKETEEIVTTLMDVFKQWSQKTQDADAKALIEKMTADLSQYAAKKGIGSASSGGAGTPPPSPAAAAQPEPPAQPA